MADSSDLETPEEGHYPVDWAPEPNLDNRRAALKQAKKEEKERKIIAGITAATLALDAANKAMERSSRKFSRDWGL